MCLGAKLSNRSLVRYKAKGKKTGYIRVWKVVTNKKTRGKGYLSDYDAHPYSAGFNHAYKRAWGENSLIHAFRTNSRKRINDSWVYPEKSSNCCLVSCLVKPEWIVAISRNCLATKAIVMPAYPKRKVTVAEFRAAIKGKKIQTYSWE